MPHQQGTFTPRYFHSIFKKPLKTAFFHHHIHINFTRTSSSGRSCSGPIWGGGQCSSWRGGRPCHQSEYFILLLFLSPKCLYRVILRHASVSSTYPWLIVVFCHQHYHISSFLFVDRVIIYQVHCYHSKVINLKFRHWGGSSSWAPASSSR